MHRGGAGLIFKGDGFYITDHRSEEYRKRAREEVDGVGRTGAGGEPGGEEVKSSPDRNGRQAAHRTDSAGGRRGDEKASPLTSRPENGAADGEGD